MNLVGEFEFKEVELPKYSKKHLGRNVSLLKNSLTLPSLLVDELGWQPGDRVDLLQSGKFFALQRSPNGVVYLRKASPRSNTLRAVSLAMAMHIRTVTITNGRFKAWTDHGRLVFSVEKEAE